MNQHRIMIFPNAFPEPQNLYLRPTQASFYPLIANTEDHSVRRLPIPPFNSINSGNFPQHNTSSMLGYGEEPIKRVKHNQQDFTEKPFKCQNASVTDEHLLLTKNIANLHQNPMDFQDLYLLKQQMIHMERMNTNELATTPNKAIGESIPFTNELMIPALKNFESDSGFQDKGMPWYEISRTSLYHQKVLEQLEQQRLEKIQQEQILQVLQKQQRRFEAVFYHQLAQEMQAQEIQKNQTLTLLSEAQKMKILNSDSPGFGDGSSAFRLNYLQDHRKLSPNSTLYGNEMESFKFPSMHPDLTLHANAKEEINDQTVMIPKLEVEDSFYTQEDLTNTKTYAQKKIKKCNSAKEEKGVAEKSLKKRHFSFDYPSTLKALAGVKEEPRRKNKWQCMIDGSDSVSTQESELPHQEAMPINVENVEVLQNAEKTEPMKPTEIPQHMIDDSQRDFNHLMYQTITNDPASLGNDTDFIVMNKDPKTTEDSEKIEAANETRVGERYQAIIPAKGEPSAREKQRCFEPVWHPGMARESLVKSYFDDLAKILGSGMINQERALKLLRRKKFKKEKVKVNISKNEKFYSKYLLINRLGSETLTNNKIT